MFLLIQKSTKTELESSLLRNVVKKKKKKCGQKEEKNSELLQIYYTPGLLLV